MKAKTLYIAARLEGGSEDQETLLGTCSLFQKYGTRAKTYVRVIQGAKGGETVETKMTSSGSGPESAGIGIYMVGHGTSTTGFAHYTAIELANLVVDKILNDKEQEKSQIRKICLLSCMAGYVRPVEGNPAYIKDFVKALNDEHGAKPMVAGFGHWISIGFPKSWIEDGAQNFPCQDLKSLTSWNQINESLDYNIERKLPPSEIIGKNAPQNKPYEDSQRLTYVGKKLIKPKQKVRYVRPPSGDEAAEEVEEKHGPGRQLKKVVFVFDTERNEAVVADAEWTDKNRFLET